MGSLHAAICQTTKKKLRVQAPIARVPGEPALSNWKPMLIDNAAHGPAASPAVTLQDVARLTNRDQSRERRNSHKHMIKSGLGLAQRSGPIAQRRTQRTIARPQLILGMLPLWDHQLWVGFLLAREPGTVGRKPSAASSGSLDARCGCDGPSSSSGAINGAHRLMINALALGWAQPPAGCILQMNPCGHDCRA